MVLKYKHIANCLVFLLCNASEDSIVPVKPVLSWWNCTAVQNTGLACGCLQVEFINALNAVIFSLLNRFMSWH